MARNYEVACIGAMLCASAILLVPAPGVAQDSSGGPEALQWIQANDQRLRWTNVADWETRPAGLQPVRVPKAWRDKWPSRTAARSLSPAGVALHLNTDSKRIVLRFTFVQGAEAAGENREQVAENSALLDMYRYFAIYRDGRFISSVPGASRFTQQDVTVYDSSKPEAEARYIRGNTSEITILLPHGYRNNQIVIGGIGVDIAAKLLPTAARTLPVVLFHGDSITHGHGNNSPREAYVWQACEMAGCETLNLGFGGSAWADGRVAEYIASRNDWDVLVVALGTNSFGGADSTGQPETAAQYKKKYDDFLNVIRARFPDKPIIAVTPILTRGDITLTKNRNGELPQQYRNGIRDVLERRQKTDRRLVIVDGLNLIHEPLYLLSTDEVHPNVAGSLRMAKGVAASLRRFVPPFKDETMASVAHLYPPNPAGVTFGQWHFVVKDLEASKKFWTILGGSPIKIDGVDVMKFPGVFVFLQQGQPGGGSYGSAINHVGFGTLNVDKLLDKWEDAGIEIDWRGISPLNGEHTGHIFTAEGVEVEITQEAGIPPYPLISPNLTMESNHLQFSVFPDSGTTKQEIENWYVQMLGANPTNKGPELTAGFPGMLFTSYGNASTPIAPTKGRSLDYIGFEVRDLEAFCKGLEAKGVKFTAPYSKTRHASFASAEIVDPAGVSIELTEGLSRF